MFSVYLSLSASTAAQPFAPSPLRLPALDEGAPIHRMLLKEGLKAGCALGGRALGLKVWDFQGSGLKVTKNLALKFRRHQWSSDYREGPLTSRRMPTGCG